MLKRQLFEYIDQTEPLTSSSLLHETKPTPSKPAIDAIEMKRSKAVTKLFFSVQKRHTCLKRSFRKGRSTEKKKQSSKIKGCNLPEQDQFHSQQKIRSKGKRELNKQSSVLNAFVLKIKAGSKSFVTPKRRIILLDWLAEVANELSISKQALQISYYYLDKINEKISIEKRDYQHFGLTCLLLSHKLDSRKVISFQMASFLVEGSLTAQGFQELELKVLKLLNFRLNPFTLWKEMNLILVGFQMYLARSNINLQLWTKIKNTALCISQGIILQTSYSTMVDIQTNICLSVLLVVLEAFVQNRDSIVSKFHKFSKNVIDHCDVVPNPLFKKTISFWFGVSCRYIQDSNPLSYHSEIKQLASGNMISI